jgi:1-deoxy-D-xylulose-5-phosphate reductoisomerase
MLPRLDRPFRHVRENGQPRGLAVLGSTGSIGTQALDIVRLFPERLRVRALAAGTNWRRLAEQARAFRPDVVALGDESAASDLRGALEGTGIEVLSGDEGMAVVATRDDVDTVVAAIVGFAGLRSTVAAVRAGKEVALANKETLVVAGELVQQLVREGNSVVLPIDSEHSAIFQCLVGEPLAAIEALTLTASGGPFLRRPSETFDAITPAEALRHPNWEMGAKVTIDSATMMNKGLEVIEARWLFDLVPDQIRVLVHPQSIVHSLVAFTDGSVKAQLGVPDMRVPIQYALSFPERWEAPHPRIDWARSACLDFEEPDLARFPSLGLAYDALRAGGAAPTVLNAANEAAVALFLQDAIRFTDIPRLVAGALSDLGHARTDTIEALEAIDGETRRRVGKLHTSLTL